MLSVVPVQAVSKSKSAQIVLVLHPPAFLVIHPVLYVLQAEFDVKSAAGALSHVLSVHPLLVALTVHLSLY